MSRHSRLRLFLYFSFFLRLFEVARPYVWLLKGRKIGRLMRFAAEKIPLSVQQMEAEKHAWPLFFILLGVG